MYQGVLQGWQSRRRRFFAGTYGNSHQEGVQCMSLIGFCCIYIYRLFLGNTGVTEWDDVGCATYSHVFKTRFTAQRVSLYGWEVPFCRSTALISKIQESLDPRSPGKLRGLAGHHYIKELTKHLQWWALVVSCYNFEVCGASARLPAVQVPWSPTIKHV